MDAGHGNFGAESDGVVTYTPAYAEGGAGYVQGAAAIDSPDSQQHVVQFPAALAVKVRVHIVKTFPLGENITTAFAEAQVYGTPCSFPRRSRECRRKRWISPCPSRRSINFP